LSQDHVWTISPVERIRHLKSFGPLTSLPLDEISLIAQHTEECAFRAGETILGGPDADERPYVIVSGQVRASADWILDEERGPGTEVGFLASLTDRWEDLEVVAETDVIALGISTDVLMDVFEDRFPVLIEAVRGMAAQSLQERQKIAEGTYLAIPKRISALPEGKPYLVDVILMLLQADAFTGAGVTALVRMARAVEQLKFPAGASIWTAGEASGSLLTPIVGEVDCRIPGGRSFRIGPGYPMGALESTARQPRWYDAVAKTDLIVFKSRTADFFDMLEDHPDVALQFLGQTAGNLVRLRSEAKKVLQTEPLVEAI
jgi:CRP-like cAMP-binding protein